MNIGKGIAIAGIWIGIGIGIGFGHLGGNAVWVALMAAITTMVIAS